MTETGPPTSIADQAFPEQWADCPTLFLRGRDKVVDQLVHGVFHHPRIQLLNGPPGAGKSIALRRLQKRLQGRHTIVSLAAGDFDRLETLAEALLLALGDEAPGDDQQTLNNCLQALADQGLPALLLLDNGDQLPAGVLEAIRDWCLDQSAPLAAVIGCQPAMAERLAGDRRYWEKIALKPLSRLGTERYLRRRLNLTGVRGDLFDEQDGDADSPADIQDLEPADPDTGAEPVPATGQAFTAPGTKQGSATLPRDTEPKPEPESEPDRASANTTDSSRSSLHQQAWIAEQSPDTWTLQLLAAYSLPPLQRLIEQLNIGGDYAYYVINQDQRDWYTLIYGSFADQAAALQATGQLAPTITKPWARRFGSIHKSLGIRH